MKGLFIVAFSCAVALTLAAAAFSAGPGWKGGCGWGTGSEYNRMYNPDSVVTFSGEVAGIDRVEKSGGMKSMGPGIHMTVKGDKTYSDTPIHLGPAWYIENQDQKLEVGDKVSVTGSKVEMGGETVIIAREVDKGGQMLLLRDESGTPNWAGWRNKRQ